MGMSEHIGPSHPLVDENYQRVPIGEAQLDALEKDLNSTFIEERLIEEIRRLRDFLGQIARNGDEWTREWIVDRAKKALREAPYDRDREAVEDATGE